MYIWIAMLSVLFSALAPTMSHAMVASQALSEEVQVCTVGGMKTVVIGKAGPGKGAPRSIDHLFEHCPYCVTHGGAMALLCSSRVVFPAPAPWAPFPPLFYQSATSLFPWTAANPRAPPAPT